MSENISRPSFDEAMAIISRNVAPLTSEMVLVENACGRIAARPVRAERDTPPFDMSAIDGYAIADSDVARQALEYEVAGELFAGSDSLPAIPEGTALSINTGAQIPAGCGTVIPKEGGTRTAGMVRLLWAPAPGRNIRRAGEDARQGELVLQPATMIRPGAIGALASFGVRSIEVYRKPRSALIVSGDEVDRQIFNANGSTIVAALRQGGAELVAKYRVRDDASVLRYDISRIFADDRADVLISTGGVSVGSRDHVRGVLKEIGARVMYHGVAMRPGKPVLFAILPYGRPFFGLPGHPVAALVGFRFFVSTALRAMQGLPLELGWPLDSPHPGKPGLTMLLKALHLPGAVPRLLPGQESHRMRALIEANRWIAVSQIDGATKAVSFPIDAIF